MEKSQANMQAGSFFPRRRVPIFSMEMGNGEQAIGRQSSVAGLEESPGRILQEQPLASEKT